MSATSNSERGLCGEEARLAWIFGSSRSGSTWLLRMLSDLESVVPVDDPHLGHHLGVWRPIPLAWAAAEETPELTTLLELKRDEPGYFFAERYRDAWWEPLRELICARFEAQARDLLDGAGPPTYVIKEPGSHVATLLTELFPASKLIFLLRDGRDVVDSWLAGYQNGSWAVPGGAFPVASWGRIALIRWLSSVWAYRAREVLRAYEMRAPESRVLIRYEELRDQTAETLEGVAALLGLESDPKRMQALVDRHAFERVPSTRRGLRRAIRLASPGSWRQNLSPAEQLAMHEVMGETLADFGYRDQQEAAVS